MQNEKLIYNNRNITAFLCILDFKTARIQVRARQTCLIQVKFSY